MKVKVRGTHHYAFRSGEWATIIGVVWDNNRACYHVAFPDDVTDTWPVENSGYGYEFKAAS